MPDIITWYLEMTSPAWLRGKACSREMTICECKIKQYPYNRFLYQWVGGPWGWTDKRGWTDAQWQAFVDRDCLRTWVAYVQGAPAGYYELEQQEDGNVEILYFGLSDRFIGRGFGGSFLSHAIQSAWDWEGTRRVWVHTCSLDHAHALDNYKARGMRIYHVRSDQV